jgi:hypothetical protein
MHLTCQNSTPTSQTVLDADWLKLKLRTGDDETKMGG